MSLTSIPMIVAALMPFADEADLNISEAEHDDDAYRARRGSLKVKDFRLARTVCDALAGLAEDPANARLIAAAPDLLEALTLAAQSAGFQYMIAETRAKIEAAIAKAEGRQ